jgi:hypothetical protein
MNEQSGEKIVMADDGEVLQKAAFSGIQVLDPELFQLITETGKFPLTGMYLRLAKEYLITGYMGEDPGWEDAGKKVPEGYSGGRRTWDVKRKT